MDISEKLEIAKKLQSHHYFFRAFWDIGEPSVGKFPDLNTAAIAFNLDGSAIQLLINEDFWGGLNEHTKLFLICHEMAHIVFQHGYRFAEYLGKPDSETMNIAADVVINEMLCKTFGFRREWLDPRLRDEGCWYDTVFKDAPVSQNESTEFYFNLLKTQKPPAGLYKIDSHKVLSEKQNDELYNTIGKAGVMSNLDEKIIDELPLECQTFVQSSTGTGSWKTVDVKANKKRKWETVIKKWEKSCTKEKYDSNERWERVNPRYSQIISDRIHLPTNCNVLDEYRDSNRIDVFFFLDTSGSCSGLGSRFFKAAKSLDPKKFNIRLFCFDTEVQETTLASGRIYGGGGTLFNIIEQKIQSIIKLENKKYPRAVFLITDGYGNNVSPEKPDRWYWFLTGWHIQYLPNKSHKFKLSDYE